MNKNERCPYDPSNGYILECELGQYGLCEPCLKGEYKGNMGVPQSSSGTTNKFPVGKQNQTSRKR